MIAIIDYGMGNLRSVQKAFEYIGEEAIITSNIEDIKKSNKIILPGVGAFPDAMNNLKNEGLEKVLKDSVQLKKPILGICLGMQLLFEESYEVKRMKGLGFLKGSIEKLYGEVKIPHMGWNNIEINNECKILQGIPNNSYVYFVHSYYANMSDENLDAYSFYGTDIPAVVSNNNIFGVQFHPEKSGEVGIKILKNFACI